MRVLPLISRLFAILVVAVLALAPVVVPQAATVTKTGTTMAMPAMGGDMDCCPKQHKSSPGCPMPCALGTLCAVKCFSNAPALADIGALSAGASQQLTPRNEPLRDRPGEPPPPRPPRT